MGWGRHQTPRRLPGSGPLFAVGLGLLRSQVRPYPAPSADFQLLSGGLILTSPPAADLGAEPLTQSPALGRRDWQVSVTPAPRCPLPATLPYDRKDRGS